MKIIFLIGLLLSSKIYADEFTDLAKRTASVFSTVAEIDANNPHELPFEILLTNQKIFLTVSATHLNSSFYTLVNSDASKSQKTVTPPPVIHVNNLRFLLDNSYNTTATCDGNDVVSTDTSCAGKDCNVTQRVISACNDSDCWKTASTTNRSLTSNISEDFSLNARVNISDCLVNNVAGYKHALKLTVSNTSSSVLNGGTVNYALILQNDVSESKRR